jgi:hypothetical protein
MTSKEFITNIEASYKGKFSDPDLKEIEQFFIDENINNIGIQNLYNAIKRKYIKSHEIPTFGQIIQIWETNKGYSPSGNSNNLHPESPLQQLYRAKDWTVEKILLNCKNIRIKQDVCGTSGLKSWEISFLVIWERLKDIFPDMQNIAKARMIANGDKELHEPVYLGDLMPELKPVEEPEPDRVGKIEHISQVLEDVI